MTLASVGPVENSTRQRLVEVKLKSKPKQGRRRWERRTAFGWAGSVLKEVSRTLLDRIQEGT
jgi:hypothetical protein